MQGGTVADWVWVYRPSVSGCLCAFDHREGMGSGGRSRFNCSRVVERIQSSSIAPPPPWLIPSCVFGC